MRASVLVFGLVLLAGCSLFGNDGTPLAFRTVGITPADSLRIDTMAVEALSPGSSSGLFLILHSEDDAEQLRAATGLSRREIPDVDWERESLFVNTTGLRSTDRLVVESVRLRRDLVETEVFIQEPVNGSAGVARTVVVAVALTGAPREQTGLSFRVRRTP